MLIKEYRVTLPLTVEEYQVAQLFCVAEASKDNTGGGEGIEVLKNEPFDNHPLLSGRYSRGQYTYKIYHIASKVPAFIRLLLPKGSLEIHEEAWNAYPYCRTVITNPLFLGKKFQLTIDSHHLNDSGGSMNVSDLINEQKRIVSDDIERENILRKAVSFNDPLYHYTRGLSRLVERVHQLPPEKLKHREVVFIDIANDKVDPHDYKKSEDPTLFKSQKTGRGPLVGKWQEKAQPIMTCYKLVTCEFKWFGLQTRVESLIQKSERRLFTTFHRQVFCSMDRWHGLTMADIRAIEEKTKHELDNQRHQGQVRGMKAEAD